MTRELSLQSLARLGFAELSAARDVLVRRGWDAEWFERAASPDKALSWLDKLFDVDTDKSVERALAKSDGGLREGLIRVLGASDGLAEFIVRSPASFVKTLAPAELPSCDQYRLAFRQSKVADSDALRRIYRQQLLTIAAWDLMQPSAVAAVQRVGQALADLTDATVDAAIVLAQAGLTVDRDEMAATRFSVIAMGKTGARELNYISDVDVIFVCEAHGIDDHRAVEVATKIARATTAIIHEPGIEPPLWELDANLRPEGAQGALVRTLESHIAYYERWAENWEFQALLKARAMAGDMDLGARYVAAVESFVWSSSSRPGFVESAQRMRERVTENIPADQRDVQIKLGPGGLRDVEFTVQLLQLVHGKDDESLRTRDTLTSLERLTSGGYVGRAESQSFADAYRALRVLEHRVQLLSLRRTHLMPRDDDTLRIIARGSGLADTPEALLAWWQPLKLEVRSLHEKIFYRPLLAAVASLPGEPLALSSDQAEARLSASGFRDPAGALRHIAALTDGISRSASMQRNLLPVLLHWMSEGANPDGGLASFRTVSENLGETHWYLRMLRDSAGAAQRLSRVLSMSTYVASLIERIPEAVAWLDDDDLLLPRTVDELSREFGAIADRHTNVDDAAKAIRFARRRELLRIALATVLDIVDVRTMGTALASVTTATIRASLTLARRGREGIEFAVIAMGRFGGDELGFSSDADVLWVFRDTGAGDDAHKRAEAIVKDINRLTEDLRFPLDIDAGLRPEGKNGPVVRSLDAYATYYETWSDVWETQALVRAVPIAGDESLCTDFSSMADSVRYSHALTEDGLREIRRIKARVESERLPFGADPSRNTKLGRGSLSDVEWLVQTLQLQNGHSFVSVRTPSTLLALEELRDSGILRDEDEAALRDAWLIASRVRSATTLYTGKNSDIVPTDRREIDGIARILAYPAGGGSELENDYLRITRRARQVFESNFYPA
ncbi:MAG: bifunctional [glutamine synthetase] adenylyltransferase/[glutamine synthetase]-adenylyl-L-tyrosine phosphorylase [Microbacteriaceae bacterium]